MFNIKKRMVSCFLENINEIAVWLHEKNREECVEIKPVVVSVCPRQNTVSFQRARHSLTSASRRCTDPCPLDWQRRVGTDRYGQAWARPPIPRSPRDRPLIGRPSTASLDGRHKDERLIISGWGRTNRDSGTLGTHKSKGKKGGIDKRRREGRTEGVERIIKKTTITGRNKKKLEGRGGLIKKHRCFCIPLPACCRLIFQSFSWRYHRQMHYHHRASHIRTVCVSFKASRVSVLETYMKIHCI